MGVSLYIFFFSTGLCDMQDLSFRTRDRTHTPGSGSREVSVSISVLLKIILLIFGCACLCCSAWAFSSFGKWELVPSCSERGLPSNCSVWAPHCGGFSCCRVPALGALASLVVAHGLKCPVACGIFPDQGSNRCPLHWQADSLPLDHPGSHRKAKF